MEGREEFKTFFEISMSMSTEEQLNEMVKFQDYKFIFDYDIEQEPDRIDKLPGAMD